MAAIVSGNGLGLFNSSLSLLGKDGPSTQATLGRIGEHLYVNAATGNLVIQQQDEYLSSLGADLAFVRTYNSQGLFNDDNADNWRLNVHRRLLGLTGTANTAGSTITKVFGDGAEVVYAFDTLAGVYLSSEGDGADDTLAFNAGDQTWTWTDGSTRGTECYDSQGRLLFTQDPDGNVVTYIYTGVLLTQVTDASGQSAYLDYTGNNLTQIRTVSQGQTQTKVRYSYDTYNRLAEVTVDLSPEDNDVADGRRYTTTYTYDGTSTRIASITQGDGTSIAFTYTEVAGQWRLATYTDGAGQVTQINYTETGLQAVTVNANPAALRTTDTIVEPHAYSLNRTPLTVPNGWQEATLLAANQITPRQKLVMDSGGNAASAWIQNDGLYVNRYDATTGWQVPTLVSAPAAFQDINIALDPQGNTYIAWSVQEITNQFSLYARRYDAVTGWSDTELLALGPSNEDGIPAVLDFKLIPDSQGNALVLWNQYEGLYSFYSRRFRTDTGWQPTELLVQTSTDRGIQITEDPQGNVFLRWTDRDNTSVLSLYVKRYDTVTGWQATHTEPNASNAPAPLLVEANGDAILQWTQRIGTQDQLYIKRFTPAGGWGSAELITSGSEISALRVARGADGDILALWQSGGTLYVRRYDAATAVWGAAQLLAAGASYFQDAQITSDAGGNTLAVWVQNQGFGTYHLYAKRFSPTAGWSDATLLGSAIDTLDGDASIDFFKLVPDLNGNVLLAWNKTELGTSTAQARRYDALRGWQSPETLGASPAISGNTRGEVFAQWVEEGATEDRLYAKHYLPPAEASAYYEVKPNDTWAGIAALLYGTAGAGNALQAAYPGMVLNPGGQLTDLPAVLTVPGYGVNSAALRTTDTLTTTTTYNLDSAPLTPTPGSWSGASLLETGTAVASNPMVGFDQNSNAIALWAESANVLVRRYDKASNSWGSAITLDTRTNAITTPQLYVDASGNAIATWVQSDGTANSIWVSRYSVSSNTWSAAQTVEGIASIGSDPSASINAIGQAAIAWRQPAAGTTTPNNLYISRFTGAGWQPPELLETRTNNVTVAPSVTLDGSGNIQVVWQQSDGTAESIYTNRYVAVTNTWSGATLLETGAVAVTNPQVRFDQGGNAIALWAESANVLVRRYDKATNSWAPAIILDTRTNVITTPKLYVDVSGNAIAAWVQSDGVANSIWASRYNVSTNTWSTAQAVEGNTSAASDPAATINANGQAAIAWRQPAAGTTTPNNLYISRFVGGSWQLPELLETRTNDITAVPCVALDALGNIQVVWQQSDGTAASIYTNRFVAGQGLSYLIQSGDTWASIAARLYGSADAAGALATALGNPPLITDNRLTNLPTSLSVATTSTVTVPPYYLVQAGDTWEGISQTLYGTSAMAPQLQALYGNAALAAGNHLNDLPASLNVIFTVPSYYLVQAGDTWESIALAVYGDVRAANALKTALRGPELVAGKHLTELPAILKFGVIAHTGPRQSEVIHPLGEKTGYFYDVSGQLLEVEAATVNGVRPRTRYAYDAQGNVVGVTNPNGNTVRLTYDAHGNRLAQQDSLGNTVTYTYRATNQLLTETTYLVPDPDGAGIAQPGNPLTARYIYDAEEHLRFTVSPEGRVCEYRYNQQGQRTAMIHYTAARYDTSAINPNDSLNESDLTAWRALQDATRSQRIDYVYDFRGQLSTTTTYSALDSQGNGLLDGTQAVTRFIYDQSGRLLQTVDARGEFTADPTDYVTTYVYDGLGRVLTTTQWVSSGETRTTISSYDDINNSVLATLANGLNTSRIYNGRGELISVIQSGTGQTLGTTTYQYDDVAGRLRITTDPTGAKIHGLYDEAGRQVAVVDGTGALTETVYDQAGHAVKQIRYATRLTSAQRASLVDADGNPAPVTLASVRPAADNLNDRISYTLYDRVDRPVIVIQPHDTDAAFGYITQSFYDGAGRITDMINYATAVNLALLPANPTADDIFITASALDRHTRTFYDNDGKLLATLDAEGFLTEHQYDAAGRLVETTAYAAATSTGMRATGSLDQLRPISGVGDQHSFFFYDARGALIGTLDAEGYLTESHYDVGGNEVEQVRYANKANPYTGTQALAQLRPNANTNDRVMLTTYDGLNQIVARTTNPTGTVSSYQYDAVGNVIATTVAVNTTEVRTTRGRYDLQGRLIGELSGGGSFALEQLLADNPTPTQAQIDQLWTQYGLTHSYDAAGRRMSTIDQNGHRTFYFYDTQGRRTHTINALGEVRESRYNAFGELRETLQYANRLSAADLAELTGGQVAPALIDKLTALVNLDEDRHTQMSYTQRGAVKQALDAEGFTTAYTYDAFGQRIGQSQQINALESLTHSYAYDKRGLLTQTLWDTLDINQSEVRNYDAFGRLQSRTNGKGNTTTYSYDKRGRVIEMRDPLNQVKGTTYDAFDRIVTQTDGLGHTTTYVYDDATHTLTVTTAEGIQTRTTRNRHGEIASVIDGKGAETRYKYDKNGNLVETIDPLGHATRYLYDRADQRIESIDANGVRTVFTYDAAARLATRTLDPAGLSLTTQYRYNSFGETIEAIDANGISTVTQYDRKGQTLTVIIDPKTSQKPDGLGLTTAYVYDGRGKTVSVTQGFGTAEARTTHYLYDKLGRRTQEIKDPDGLHIVTAYTYDLNDNIIAKTEAAGTPISRTTRYVYDAADRLSYMIDALGGTTNNSFDAEGRITHNTRFVNAISLAGLGNALAETDVTTRLTIDAARDQATRYVYDQDGRRIFTRDALNNVIETVYDASGNVIKTIAYANPIASGTANTVVAIRAVLTLNSTQDRVTRNVYDAANRAVYAVDAQGYITESRYDKVGNRTDSIRYNDAINPASLTANPVPADIVAALTARVNPDSTQDQRTQYAYDAAGRLRQMTDALNHTEHYTYDGVGNKQSFTNKKGAFAGDPQYTWHYAYDAAGRLIEEKTPAVNIARLQENSDGTIAAVSTVEPMITKITYDALGNVHSRTEAAGTVDARTTTYLYDRLGRQIQTVFPQERFYDPALDQANGYIGNNESLQTPTSTTYYDDLGNAYAGRDVLGRFSYKVYDALGRVIYEIDAKRQVTAYTYDPFGNQLSLTRYASPLSASTFTGREASATDTAISGFTAADLQALLVPSTEDRTITNTYDALNHKIETRQPLVFSFDSSAPAASQYFIENPTTKNTYNAFGEVVKQSQLKNPLSTTWVDTFCYYNNRGEKIAQIDALGYLTAYQYDANGNLTESTEYARALAPTTGLVIPGTYNGTRYSPIATVPGDAAATSDIGFDRTTRYVYDTLNRKVREAKVQAQFTSATYGGTVTLADRLGDLTMQYTYDAVGNLTSTTDALGATTRSYFDTLGRTIAVAEPARVVEGMTPNLPALTVTYTSPTSASVSWVGPPDDSIVQFRYHLSENDPWQTATVQTVGDQRVVDVSSWVAGNYQYEISYFHPGELVSYMRGSGALDLTGLSAANIPYVVEFIEQQYFTIDVVNATWSDETLRWESPSSVTLRWADLLSWGGGNVKVSVEYAEARSSGFARSRVPPFTLTGEFSAEAARHGVTLQKPISNVFDMQEFALFADGKVDRVRVWKVVDGEDVLLLDRNSNSIEPERLILRGNTTGLAGITVDGVQLGTTHLGNNVYSVNVSSLSRGIHTYTIYGTGTALSGVFEAHGAAPHSRPLVQEKLLSVDASVRLVEVPIPGTGDGTEGSEETMTEERLFLRWSPFLDWGDGLFKVETLSPAPDLGKHLVQSKTFTALEGLTGVEVTVNQPSRVLVYKRVNGVDILFYDRDFGHEQPPLRDTSASQLIISDLPATADSAVFQYRSLGDQGAYRTVSTTRAAPGWFLVNYKDIPNGQYEYKLLVRSAAGEPVDLSAIGGTADGTYVGSVQVLRGATAVPVVDLTSNAAIVSPITTFRQDIFGKVLAQMRHANGALVANIEGYTLGASDVTNDQYIYCFYDRYGHKTREVSAEGASKYFSYDIGGNLRKEWMTVTDHDGGQQNRVTLHDYDSLGHESTTGVLTESGAFINTEMEYDAFGEMTRRGVDGGRQEYFNYDHAGRLWRTNQGDGADKVYLYNLQGHGTSLIQSAQLDLSSAQYTGPADVAMLVNEVRRTDNVVDALGRVVAETKPWFETQSIESTPQFAADVFGRIGVGIIGSGGSVVDLQWTSLARFGNGAVRVTIDFDSSPGGTGGFTQVYDSAVADRGIEQSFNFEITRIDSVQVWKQVDGYEVLIHNRALPGVQRNLTWRRDALPGSIVTLEYAKIGSDQWTALAVEDRGNYFWADVGALATDQYQYRVSHRHPDADTPYRQTTGTFGVTGATSAGATNIAAFTESALATVTGFGGKEVRVAWDSLAPWGEGPVRVSLRVAVNSNGLGAIVNLSLSAVDSYTGAILRPGISIFAVDRVQVFKIVDGSEVLVRDTAATADTRAVLMGNTTGLMGINVEGMGTFSTSHLGAGAFAATLGPIAAGHYRFTPLGGNAQAPGALVVGNVPAPQQTVVGILLPTRTQIVDRWGNTTSVTDARGFTTQYRFDYANQVTREVKSRVSILRENGTSYVDTPTTSFSYSALGRLVATKDANGNLSTIEYDSSGERLAEYQADSGVVEHVYDALGREVAKIDATGSRTEMVYDRNNELTAVHRPLTADRYQYNEAGERISHTIVMDSEQHNETLAYFYDTRGNLIKTRQPLGQEAYISYDARGNKIAESFAQSAGAPLADSQTWTYDYFGKLKIHRDLGNRTYRYFYDEAGALTHQIGNTDPNSRSIAVPLDISGAVYDPHNYANDVLFRAANPGIDQYLRYEYFHNGQLRTIADLGTNTETGYEYDAAGNRTRETYARGGSVVSETRVTYDSTGRVGWVMDNRYTMTYAYDAADNRRRGQGTYRQETGDLRTFDNWYLYDSMNRVVLNAGELVNGTIQMTSNQGMEITYDAAGNRRTARGYASIDTGLRAVSDEGDDVAIGGRWILTDEKYFYDAEYRLTETHNTGGLTSERFYDRAGRLQQVNSYSYTRPGQLGEKRVNTYNKNGWLLFTNGFDANNAPKYLMDYNLRPNTTSTSSGNYDAQGHLLGYRMLVYGQNGHINDYTYNYAKYDTYKESSLDGASTQFVNGNTSWSYDANGNLVGVQDREKPQNSRTFLVDTAGQIQQMRKDGKVQNFYYFGGRPIGSAGQMDRANFDFNFQPIGQGPAATPGSYVVNSGDTLHSIALEVYGDGNLWYLIADANGITSDSELFFGQTLRIPNVIANTHNNASTFKPYNPAQIIGSTDPTMPMPEPDKCKQIIVMVVAIVVTILTWGSGAIFASMLGALAGQVAAVALGLQDSINIDAVVIAGVTAVLAPGIAQALNVATSAIATAIIQSTLNQGLNIAMGQQDKFDWRAVATSGITAGVLEGIEGISDVKFGGEGADSTTLYGFNKGFMNDFTKGILKGAINQTVKHEVYDGGKFDWAEVAADSFGNAIGNFIVGQMKYSDEEKRNAKTTANAREFMRREDGVYLDQYGREAPTLYADASKYIGTTTTDVPPTAGVPIWDLNNGSHPEVVVTADPIVGEEGGFGSSDNGLSPYVSSGGQGVLSEPGLFDYLGTAWGGWERGVNTFMDNSRSFLADEFYDFDRGGFYNTKLGGVFQATGEWLSNEVWTTQQSGFAKTNTAHVLKETGGFLSYLFTERSFSDSYQDAVDLTSRGVEAVANWWNNTTGVQKTDQIASFLGGEAVPFALTAGTGRTLGTLGRTEQLTYDISKWGEYGLPSDGTFVRTLTREQYRDFQAGRSFNFGGASVEGYPNGMGFIGSTEEVRGITTSAGYKEALKLNYEPKYVLEFQLRDPAGLRNVTSAPYPEFRYGGKTGAGYKEWNYPGIGSNDIVNPRVRILK